MTRVIHVVGVEGSGKSTIILALGDFYAARGQVCGGVDPEPPIETRAEALVFHPDADIVFVEHRPGQQFQVEPEDRVITITQGGAWDGELRLDPWLAEQQELQALSGAVSATPT